MNVLGNNISTCSGLCPEFGNHCDVVFINVQNQSLDSCQRNHDKV